MNIRHEKTFLNKFYQENTTVSRYKRYKKILITLLPESLALESAI